MSAPPTMMDPPMIGGLVAAVLLLSVIILAGMCFYCRTKGPLVSIRQGDSSEEDIPLPGFRVIHPYQNTPGSSYIVSSSTLTLPFSPSQNQGSQRHPSFTLTENESNPSYEGTEEREYENTRQEESDAEETGYVKVLPDEPKVEIRQSSQSLASTHSSVDVEPAYVNVDPKDDSDESSYLNVVPNAGETQEVSCERDKDSDYDDDDNDDSEDEGNYVNQPMMIG